MMESTVVQHTHLRSHMHACIRKEGQMDGHDEANSRILQLEI
jgi:hypothetical protein